jgi:CO/xanthine dehydrogenase FAD-binding subunit
VRLEDRSLTQVRATGARITIGAGITLSQILRDRELSFLHEPARLIGGPAVRTAATVGGNLFAPAPYGDLAVGLVALDATVSVMGAMARVTWRWKSFWRAATEIRARLF